MTDFGMGDRLLLALGRRGASLDRLYSIWWVRAFSRALNRLG